MAPRFTAASPPSVVNPLVPAAPVTSPLANAFAMVPLFKPTSPPPLPFDPTLTAMSVAETLRSWTAMKVVSSFLALGIVLLMQAVLH